MRPFRHLSIRSKLTLVLLLTSGVGLLLAGAAIIAYEFVTSRQRLAADLSALAGMVGGVSAAALRFDDPVTAQENLERLKTRPEIVAAAIYAPDGSRFAFFVRGSDQQVPPTPASGRSARPRFRRGLLEIYRSIVQDEDLVGIVYLRADLRPLYAHLGNYARIVAAATVGLLLVTLLLAGGLQRLIADPIVGLARVARGVSERQDFSVRAPRRGHDEIGRLIDTFNEMLYRLQERDTALRDSNDALHGEVIDRLRAEEDLRRLNETLEHRVRERTDELEQQTRELARSNAELEMFAYVASHDLQEPLRGVAGCMQLLERRYKGKLDASADELIAHAVDGATRMQALVHDLLAFSRVGTRAKAFEPVDVAVLVGRALANLRAAIEESGARVTQDALPTVIAEPTQLTQLFQNLVGNAIKFQRPGVPPEIHVGARRDEDAGEWRFWVRDNGIGIDAQYAERIFVIFQRLHTRTAYPGTGIGLAVCKKIVERHGGRIWVESAPAPGEPGAGSTFFFTLPDRGDHHSV